MQISKSRILAIAIVILLMSSISFSTILIPKASAHTPAWQIPTYAYITAEPNPIGVGQSLFVYVWLDAVYGAAGGTTAVIGTNASTASAALTANNYRFQNFQVVITAPDGTKETKAFAVISDPTSSQLFSFTPSQVGTYSFNFTFPGQVYGASGDGYEKSPIFGDTYLPSSASTTLNVQQSPISAAQGSTPLPSEYWAHPIYGEGTDWWAISSDWLGSGSPVPAGYTTSTIFHGDAIGPQTAHIMWTKPLQFGGIVAGTPFVSGGSTPGNGGVQGAQYFEGTSYEPRFVNPIVINGYLYYTEAVSFTGPSSGPTDCLDLRTGQVIWSRSDVPPLSFGYIYNLWNGEQHGTFPPILFTANFGQAFDAYTGDPLFNVTNVPSGTAVAGPSGEQLRYVFANAGTPTNPQWYLAQWNSSKLWQYDVNPYTGGGSLNPSIINASNLVLVSTTPINPNTGTTGTIPTSTGGTTVSVPYGSAFTINANIPINATTLGLTGKIAGPGINTYDWNVSLPWLNSMPLGVQVTVGPSGSTITPTPPGSNPVTVIAANTGDVMLCRNGSLPIGFMRTYSGVPQIPYTLFAINLNASRGAIGTILWMQNYDPPTGNLTLAIQGVDWQNRVFIINYGETMQWVGYSLDNGNKLWGPTTPQAAFDYYTTSYRCLVAYGNLYSMGYAGICYCFNDLTGNLKWTYGNGGSGNSTNAGLNVFYGDYPTMMEAVANGVLYTATSEHTMPNPFYKGCTYRAINATTGQEIWQLSGYPSEWSTPGSQWATADGFIACMNGLDNNIYSIGRGPSATTVTAPNTGLSLGSSVVIRGSVIDTSAGTKQSTQAADFPNGVPVASDASMKDWMGYVYQQKALPTNFTGVPVTISVLDSNGNYRNIGTATTDATGMYTVSWKPDITGNFTVVATFNGSNGYWPSHSETSFAVDSASPTASPYPVISLPPTEMYVVGTGIAVIIAIAIVGLVVVLMLRKRP
jgi:outer membrane protein assembly factor BamB